MADNHAVEVNGARQALGDPDFQAKFVRVIERLAEWDEALGDVSTAIAFGRELVQDRESMRYLMASASDEIPLRVDRDTIVALAELASALPTLVQLMRPLLQFAEFAKAVLEDRASVDYLLASLASEFEAVQRMAQEAREISREAGRIAAEDRTPVTVWSLIRLLKEPVVQKGLRYAKAFVQAAQERTEAPPVKNL